MRDIIDVSRRNVGAIGQMLAVDRVDTSKWSGEGAFTQAMIDRLQSIEDVAFVRVEDAPASRSEADYNFISNEIYVGFETGTRQEATRRLGLFPGTRTVSYKKMTV